MRYYYLPLTAVLSLPLLACASEAPDNPTWVEDVRPILVANCVRCHTTPSIGGAPSSFRLDVAANTVLDDGTLILGASAMSEYIAARAQAGDMPPRFPLTDRQRDVLDAWHALATPESGAPFTGARAFNAEPTITVETSVEGASLVIDYTIGDDDRDIVVGTLVATGPSDIPITGELHNGTGRVIWDTQAAQPGDYDLDVTLHDGVTIVDRRVGTHTVAHDNTAPSVSFNQSFRDLLVTDASGPTDVGLSIFEIDSQDTVSVRLEAETSGQLVELAPSTPASAFVSIDVDLSQLPAGRRWWLRAIATDGEHEVIEETGPFIVGHEEASLRYDDISDIFDRHCVVCHPSEGPGPIPGVSFGLGSYDEVLSLAGTIYRRVVDQRNMPPISASHLYNIELSIDDRQRLGDWLLGGAPE